MNRDEYGIIGQIQPGGWIEGGDSACWMGHWVYLTGEKFPFVKTFEKGWGGYVRHPDPASTYNGFGAYYRNPWMGCISRDQMTGILVGLIGQKEYMAMLRLVLNHALKGFLFVNKVIYNGMNPAETKFNFFKLFYNPKPHSNHYKIPDITVMDMWATMLRGFGWASWVFFPLLCVLDLHLLFGAMHDKYFDNQEPDVINFIGKLLVSREHVPTPVSWLATKFVSKDNLMARLTKYWCGWRANCEFVPHFEKKLDKILT